MANVAGLLFDALKEDGRLHLHDHYPFDPVGDELDAIQAASPPIDIFPTLATFEFHTLGVHTVVDLALHRQERALPLQKIYIMSTWIPRVGREGIDLLRTMSHVFVSDPMGGTPEERELWLKNGIFDLNARHLC
ncbi:hypothetical protein EW146_g7356 [Bondarzewia mesenterica]|uniref:Uncharacterized protein n=1 Tax=Bondarzewia mesenterica TaxID=1095465 RepID=A0A4S4LL15_9AGAM|nr:hypothetical protein EW146_g7356 [Bondarzewia mesenterica]